MFPPAREAETPGWLFVIWFIAGQLAREAAKHPDFCLVPSEPQPVGDSWGCCRGAPYPLWLQESHLLGCMTDGLLITQVIREWRSRSVK